VEDQPREECRARPAAAVQSEGVNVRASMGIEARLRKLDRCCINSMTAKSTAYQQTLEAPTASSFPWAHDAQRNLIISWTGYRWFRLRFRSSER
jgi:hypothetical protein